MKLKGAIFDMDGTLLDSMYIWYTAGQRYLERLGIQPRPDLRERIKTMSIRQTAVYFQAEYGLTASREEIIRGINKTVEDAYFYEIRPKPGVPEALERLKKSGAQMCVATATDRYLVEKVLSRCGLDRYFSRVFTCTEVGAGKDQPDIFRRALAFLGTEKSETAVFEDALYAVRTAKADGFPVAAVFDCYSEKDRPQILALADYAIPTFENWSPDALL